MFGMNSEDTAFVILLTVYGIYCAWAKYCEHRWQKPEDE
jgi:hypothetical protein